MIKILKYFYIIKGAFDSHGRTRQLPDGPHADPGVRNYRTGLFNNTRFAQSY
jgi:hypothetical protein